MKRTRIFSTNSKQSRYGLVQRSPLSAALVRVLEKRLKVVREKSNG